MSSEEKKKKNYCDNCQNDTNHSVLFVKREYPDFDDYHIEWRYYVVQCMGCEKVSFLKETIDYEMAYPDEDNNWNPEVTSALYPEPLKDHRPVKETYLLPSQIQTVYKETINALKSRCFLLAGVGFRALIEAICIDKEISGRNLEIKINNLSRNRFITDKEAERLHAVRFMGNDSVHEMTVPKEKNIICSTRDCRAFT